MSDQLSKQMVDCVTFKTSSPFLDQVNAGRQAYISGKTLFMNTLA